MGVTENERERDGRSRENKMEGGRENAKDGERNGCD